MKITPYSDCKSFKDITLDPYEWHYEDIDNLGQKILKAGRHRERW
jgi:hypothetical protein